MRKAVWILGALSLVLAGSNFLLWRQLRHQQVASLSAAKAWVSPVCESVRPRPNTGTDCSARGLERSEPAPRLPPEADADLYGRVQRNPEFQAGMVAYQRIALGQEYAAFIAGLRLPPEKADELTLILAEQWVGGAQGIPPEYTREEWQRRNEDELRALLSPAQIDAFRHYKETAGTRELVDSLRGELMVTREPLRDDQVEPLIEAIHPEEMRLMEEANAFNQTLDESSAAALEESDRRAESRFIELETAATQRKLAAAGAILSRDQLKVLKSRLEARQAMGQAGSRLRRLQFELAESGSRSGSQESAN